MTDKVFSKLRKRWDAGNRIQYISLNKRLNQLFYSDPHVETKGLSYDAENKTIEPHTETIELIFRGDFLSINDCMKIHRKNIKHILFYATV